MRRTLKLIALALLPLAFAGCQKAQDTASPVVAEPEPAPAPTASADEARPFAIGSLSAFALRDGEAKFPNDQKVFGIQQTPEAVNAVLTAAGLPTDQLTLNVQPLLVKAGERVLLFDTGAGRNMGAGAGHLADALAAARAAPDSVTDVFISHLHGDHIGGLVNAAGTATYPNAAIHLSAAEWKTLKGLKPEQATAYGIAQYAETIAAITSKVATFEPGAEIIPGVVRAMDIKGHTPGHSGYLIGSGSDTLFYVGDAMHHSVISVQKPAWAVAFDGDVDTATKSRVALLEQLATSGQRVYAVHFPYPGIGRIDVTPEGLKWMPEP